MLRQGIPAQDAPVLDCGVLLRECTRIFLEEAILHFERHLIPLHVEVMEHGLFGPGLLPRLRALKIALA